MVLAGFARGGGDVHEGHQEVQHEQDTLQGQGHHGEVQQEGALGSAGQVGDQGVGVQHHGDQYYGQGVQGGGGEVLDSHCGEAVQHVRALGLAGQVGDLGAGLGDGVHQHCDRQQVGGWEVLGYHSGEAVLEEGALGQAGQVGVQVDGV